MKVTKLLDIQPALQALTNVKIKRPFSMRIASFANDVRAITDIYHADRNKLLTELGTPDEKQNGSFKFATSEKAAEFVAQEKKLLEDEVEIKIPPIISYAEMFGDQDIEPAILMPLIGILITKEEF